MTFTQPLCLSPKGCTVCVCVFVSTIIRIPLMVVGVRKKAGYAVCSPFPHRFVFSLPFPHSFSTFPHRYFAFFLSPYFFSFFYKTSFSLSKSNQLYDNSYIFKYAISVAVAVCNMFAV